MRNGCKGRDAVCSVRLVCCCTMQFAAPVGTVSVVLRFDFADAACSVPTGMIVSDLPSLAPVMIFQYQKAKILKKRKNRKNDFPREVEKFPSRGSKKKLREGNFQHSAKFCKDNYIVILLSMKSR